MRAALQQGRVLGKGVIEMRTWNKAGLGVVAMVAAGLAGCVRESGSGTVRGRVLDASGHPVAGARVSLDRVGGRTTLTNVRGEFSLGARDGGHLLLAYSAAKHAAGSVDAEVDGGIVDVGDVWLVDCDLLVGGGEGTTPMGGEDGAVPPDPDDPSIMPCVVEPPPPPVAHLQIDSLDAEYADAFVDSWGIYGYADDGSAQAGLDFWIPAELTAGGTYSAHVLNDYEDGEVQAHVGLFTWGDPDGWGYYYVLREGNVSVTVSDDGDGDPETLAFSFTGTNLVFDYAGWNGIEPEYTASVGSATASGHAWRYVPPEPPTEDLTIASFVADWSYISLCPECAEDGGDALFLYAFDGTNQADLSLFTPVSSLVLGGTAALEGGFSSDVYGWASVYTDGGGWSYDLDHLTASVGPSVVVGSPLPFVVTGAQFNYVDAYGGGVIAGGPDGTVSSGGSGGAPPEEPPVSDLQLFIGAADLSAIVDDFYGGTPVEPGDPGSDDPGLGHGHGGIF